MVDLPKGNWRKEEKEKAMGMDLFSNKRAMALYTCVDKGNEKLAYDLNYLNISLQMVSEVI